MIWDATPWKTDLLKDASLLERWATKTNRPLRQGMIFEKKVFGASYAIRKLFEADKVCTALPNTPVLCLAFKRVSPAMAPWNWHRVDEHFDLEAGSGARLTATALVNQIIHSHVFLLRVNEVGHVDGFLVSSRQGRKQRLLAIALADFCALMREVGEDHPTERHTVWDASVGDYVTVQSCPSHGGMTTLPPSS